MIGWGTARAGEEFILTNSRAASGRLANGVLLAHLFHPDHFPLELPEPFRRLLYPKRVLGKPPGRVEFTVGDQDHGWGQPAVCFQTAKRLKGIDATQGFSF